MNIHLRHPQKLLLVLIIFCILTLFGCRSKDSLTTNVESNLPDDFSAEISRREPNVLLPTADGTVTYSNEVVIIDASNSMEGYVMIRYLGTNPKVKLRIATPGFENEYQYTLRGNDYETFPLTGGNGNYTFSIYEHVTGNSYAMAAKFDVQLEIKDEFTPFLYPNQYVPFNKDSDVVELSANLITGDMSELEIVDTVYHYLTDNISYDYDKAQSPPALYLPNPDETLETKTGICFDYAAVMASMLRSQGIPTRLSIGYAGTVYHAWISTYITGIGWIDKIVEFDGENWTLLDPTFASTGKNDKETKDFISDSSNYETLFIY